MNYPVCFVCFGPEMQSTLCIYGQPTLGLTLLFSKIGPDHGLSLMAQLPADGEAGL